MALTKVRLPVADISAISDNDSNVTVDDAGGTIDVVVNGATIASFDATGVDLGVLAASLQTLAAQDVDVVNGTVVGQVHADAAEVLIGTTSAHPTTIMANSIDGLEVGTDGKVTLGVEGTSVGHLVTKAYVDAAVALGLTLTSVDSTVASSGHITIPNSSGNDLIINWGVTAPISNTQAAVTFDEAFPNACFVAMATRQNGTASLESAAHVNTITTTGMNVVNSGGTSSPVGWIAIGY